MTKTKLSKPQARGRPALSDHEVAEMRRHISACALRLFQSEGYEAVSMRRLAIEAGCTVMTIYRYFDRKIDILRALWDEVFNDLFDHLDKIAAREEAPLARLNAISLGYVNYWLKHREHYFLVFMSSGVSQPDVSVFVEDGAAVQRYSLFSETLGQALYSETGAIVDIDLKAQLLLCTLNGIAHNLITISGYPWSDADRLVSMAVSGVTTA